MEETITCRWCGRPRPQNCKGDGTAHVGPGAFARCPNDSEIETESIPLRKKHGFLTWERVFGTAKSWKGRRYYVFYVGRENNDQVIVRSVKGGESLLLKKKSFFEEIDVEVRHAEWAETVERGSW